MIWRTIPSGGNRRALMERGDADISFDLPAKDFTEMKKDSKLKLISNPVGNGMYSLELNVVKPPFNNEKVRQAIAYAIPYQKIIDAAMFGHAKPLFGGKSNSVTEIVWPQATGYKYDLEKAKALMKESGVGPIESTISFDLGDAITSEPMAVLIQESLAPLGIKLAINKVPGANWRSKMAKKEMPMMVNFFSGWLDYPEYFFWCTRARTPSSTRRAIRQGHGRLHRRRLCRRRYRRKGKVRHRREGLHFEGLQRHAARADFSALSQRATHKTSPVTNIGSTGRSTTASS